LLFGRWGGGGAGGGNQEAKFKFFSRKKGRPKSGARCRIHFAWSSLILGLRPSRNVLISPTLVLFSHVRKHTHTSVLSCRFPPSPILRLLLNTRSGDLSSSFSNPAAFFLRRWPLRDRKFPPHARRSVFIPLTYLHSLPPLSSFSPSRPSPPTIHLSGQLLTDDLLEAFPLYGGFDRVPRT